MDDECEDFTLYPMDIQQCSVFLTSVKRLPGPDIPADSTGLLPSGDYGLVITNKYCDLYQPPGKGIASFAEIRSIAKIPDPPAKYRFYKRLLHWFDPPLPPVEDLVSMRDGGRCLITGSSQVERELKAVWLIPPARVELLRHNSPYNTPAQICIPSNAILLCKDLADAFFDNAFGVDVDDNYRIVMFRDIGDAGNALLGSNSQAYFRRPEHKSQLNGPKDYFLREHFVHCLYVHMRGGDITDDYSPDEIAQALSDLGLWDYGDQVVSFDDPRWQTQLGKEIYRAHMASKLPHN